MDPGDLYGLPLERFVPERGALAKTLRAEKKREEAAEVAKLRKPTVAAWAVNQLVRTQGAAVKELFDAGDAVRETQANVVAGRADGAALRAAGQRQRDALQHLVDTARGLLSSEGHELSATVIERVADTLRAASFDEVARAQVRDGRLERELRHAGLGLVPGAVSAPPKRRATKKEDEAAARAERERAAARKAAEGVEAKARRRMEKATRALAKAEEALAAAREEAEAAAEAHARARADLEQK